jgi:hypothetical protein
MDEDTDMAAVVLTETLKCCSGEEAVERRFHGDNGGKMVLRTERS